MTKNISNDIKRVENSFYVTSAQPEYFSYKKNDIKEKSERILPHNFLNYDISLNTIA